LELSGGSINITSSGININSNLNDNNKLIDLILGSGLSTMNSHCRSAIKSYLGKCSIRRDKLLKERVRN